MAASQGLAVASEIVDEFRHRTRDAGRLAIIPFPTSGSLESRRVARYGATAAAIGLLYRPYRRFHPTTHRRYERRTTGRSRSGRSVAAPGGEPDELRRAAVRAGLLDGRDAVVGVAADAGLVTARALEGVDDHVS